MNMFAGLGQSSATPEPLYISQSTYQQWRQEYLFDALQNLRYGQSFCNAFNITDNILFFERNTDWADDYIRNYYVR